MACIHGYRSAPVLCLKLFKELLSPTGISSSYRRPSQMAFSLTWSPRLLPHRRAELIPSHPCSRQRPLPSLSTGGMAGCQHRRDALSPPCSTGLLGGRGGGRGGVGGAVVSPRRGLQSNQEPRSFPDGESELELPVEPSSSCVGRREDTVASLMLVRHSARYRGQG